MYVEKALITHTHVNFCKWIWATDLVQVAKKTLQNKQILGIFKHKFKEITMEET